MILDNIVTLRIVPGSDPIRGVLADARGDERSFCGWLELSVVIEDVRTHDVAAVSPPAPSGGPES